MNTDPITDMLNRIRNAQAVNHQTVDVPFSKLKFEIAKLLEKYKFIGKIEKKAWKIKGSKPIKTGGMIEITLKYYENKLPVISGLKRVSRPGQRIYIPTQNIKKVRGGYGINIVSTSKGLMVGAEARKQKVGGEVLCEIW